DDEALAAFHELARTEGILAALESSHAVAQGIKLARDMAKDKMILVNLSGRGDKDVHTIARAKGFRCESHRRTFRATQGERPDGADPFHHRRRSVAGSDGAAAARA